MKYLILLALIGCSYNENISERIIDNQKHLDELKVMNIFTDCSLRTLEFSKSYDFKSLVSRLSRGERELDSESIARPLLIEYNYDCIYDKVRNGNFL
jgi:hypothetical protein